MNEIMSVNVSTEKDPSLVQIGSTLSSEEDERLVALLKDFKNVLRGPVKTCLESILRLYSTGSLSASDATPLLSNPEP